MNDKLFLILLAAVCTINAGAQQTPIETDRPDQTETAVTVPKYWIQAEMGFSRLTYKNDNSYKEKQFQHPSLLLKYGLGKRFELRMITNEGSIKEYASNSIFSKTGITSAQLGFKGSICEEKGLRPKISLIGHYSFGRLRTLYKDSIDGANFRFAIQHSLTEKLAISSNLGMDWEEFGMPPAYTYTFAPGYTFNEKWYAYIEVFGFVWKDFAPENSIDGGIAFNISNNVKADVSAGFGISKEAPRSYFSVGFSFRFKAKK